MQKTNSEQFENHFIQQFEKIVRFYSIQFFQEEISYDNDIKILWKGNNIFGYFIRIIEIMDINLRWITIYDHCLHG